MAQEVIAIGALDLVLGGSVLVLGAALLSVRDLFAAIVLFIVFGLLVATIWARLEAVDIALAEAAIGAGLTGALLLNALGDLAARRQEHPGTTAQAGSPGGARRALAALLVAPVALLLGHAVLTAPTDLDVLRPRVDAALDAAGAEHPVTAVLLGFRAYDTLLELAVLLLAVAGAWALRLPRAPRPEQAPGPVLEAAERLLIPAAVLIGGYLLWRGSHAPGGAFQGGAVLAGAAVLVRMARRGDWPGSLAPLLRPGLALAVALFAGVGLAATALARPFLFYRGQTASILILLIEAAAAVSIALALASVFVGRDPDTPEERP